MHREWRTCHAMIHLRHVRIIINCPQHATYLQGILPSGTVHIGKTSSFHLQYVSLNAYHRQYGAKETSVRFHVNIFLERHVHKLPSRT